MRQPTLISGQPTTVGKTVGALCRYGARVYLGYGDYSNNTGPIHLLSVDADDPTGTLHDELTFRTEQVALFRRIGAALWVPAIDPQGWNLAADGDALAVATAPGSWSVVTDFDVFPTHVFDIRHTADGIWLAGAREAEGADGQAVVWRSTDNGASFQVSHSESAPMNEAGNSIRYYTLIPVGDDLYVQRSDEGGFPAPPSGWRWSHTDAAWQSVATWPSPSEWLGWKAAPWDANTALLMWQGPSAVAEFYTFRPTGDESGWVAFVPVPGFPNVYDYDIDAAGALYALRTDGAVYWTADLTHWSLLTTAPTGAMSLAVDPDGSHLWFGTADSALWVSVGT